jgi:proline dehydrogenase
VDPNADTVWFGQLYGMSDNLSFNLAKRKYNVFKMVPFGPIADVMLTLLRRARRKYSSGWAKVGHWRALVEEEIERRDI